MSRSVTEQSLRKRFVWVEPPTSDSLAQLTQQIIEACGELQAVPQGWRNSKEFKLAVDCLEQLLVEYRYQSDDLAARKV